MVQYAKEWLEKQSFQHTDADHFVFANTDKHLILAAYVDDLLIVGPRGNPDVALLKKALRSLVSGTNSLRMACEGTYGAISINT